MGDYIGLALYIMGVGVLAFCLIVGLLWGFDEPKETEDGTGKIDFD